VTAHKKDTGDLPSQDGNAILFFRRNMPPIQLVLIDDHPLFREGVKKALTSFPDLQVVGEAGTAGDGLILLRTLKPDVALLDINLPDDNGLQVTRKIISENLATRIILLTGYMDSDQPFHAFRAGVAAFCTKDIEHEQLAEIIRLVAAGKWVFEGRVMDSEERKTWLDEQLSGKSTDHAADQRFSPLTNRESEILHLVARGLTNKQIGYLLGISEQTVKNHLTSLLRKIGAGDRTQAVVYALKHGWIRLPEGGEPNDATPPASHHHPRIPPKSDRTYYAESHHQSGSQRSGHRHALDGPDHCLCGKRTGPD
jgi:DNA-binding NarL/FixJ family response regulator